MVGKRGGEWSWHCLSNKHGKTSGRSTGKNRENVALLSTGRVWGGVRCQDLGGGVCTKGRIKEGEHDVNSS